MQRSEKIPGLWLMGSSGAIRIYCDDIVYCHHNNDITKIVYSSGRFTTAQIPLKKIELKLCKNKFYRCHRNYLINLNHAGEGLRKDDTLGFQRRSSIPVSRRRKNTLLVKLEKIASGQDISA